jgi:REP element-mobilizing transposase RayT
MILAYHVVFSAYGFWLPNDPRGSWSDFVGSWELFRFRRATKTDERRSLAQDPHDRSKRIAAKQVLKYPAVSFSGVQARAIGRGFGRRVENSEMTVWACAILPEHIHMVIARHSYDIERVVMLLKSEATEQLGGEGLHPFERFRKPDGKLPTCWTRGEWKVFLDSEEDIIAAIEYVNQNPIKEGKPAQRWPFVKPFAPTGDDMNDRRITIH